MSGATASYGFAIRAYSALVTKNIWPYEVKTTCDYCHDDFEPGELWFLFEGEAVTSGDIVCQRCIPQDAWNAWEAEGDRTDAENVLAWLLDGSPECAQAAADLVVRIRGRREQRALLVRSAVSNRPPAV